MIALGELLGKYKMEDQPSETQANLKVLLDRVNKIRLPWGRVMIVTSGLRSMEDQLRINPSAPKSKHLVGLACDVADYNGDLMRWVLANLNLMRDAGLYMEDFRYTPTWVHFQGAAPMSGKRVFVPSAALPPAPERWDGRYDSYFDNAK